MRIAAVLSCAIWAIACQPEQSGADAPAATNPAHTQRVRAVKLLTVQPRAFAEIIEVNGTLSAPNDVTVAAQGSGTIISIAKRGDRVAAGGALARIDPALPSAGAAQATAQVALARAGLRLAEDTLARQKPLYEKQIISALEYRRLQAQRDQARAQVQQAQAAASQARTQMKYTVVETPFAGTVETLFAEKGEQLMPGKPVARVVNTARLTIEAGVPERYASDISGGAKGEVILAAYGLPPRQAVVSFVGSAIDPATRTFPVEFDLDNPNGVLKPAMSVRVRLSRSELRNTLVVPQTAVLRDEDGTSVFVVGEGVARRTRVEVGVSNAGEVQVISGLSPGDRVVVRGQASLTEGDRVRPEEASP